MPVVDEAVKRILDIKLMAMLSFFIGWKLTILVMFLSFLIGTIFGIFYMIFRKARVKDYMPLGPAIALATVIILFWGQQIINNHDKATLFNITKHALYSKY